MATVSALVERPMPTFIAPTVTLANTDNNSPMSSCVEIDMGSDILLQGNDNMPSSPPNLMVGKKRSASEDLEPLQEMKKPTLVKSSSFQKTLDRVSPRNVADDNCVRDLDEVRSHIETATRNRIHHFELACTEARKHHESLSSDPKAGDDEVRKAHSTRSIAEEKLHAAESALEKYLCAHRVVKEEEEEQIKSNRSDPEMMETLMLALDVAESELSEIVGVCFLGVPGGGGKTSPLLRSSSNDRSTGEWVLTEIKSMQNSVLTKSCLDRILSSENFAMLTGENPFALAHDDCANTAFNNAAKDWLQQRGLSYHETVGRYDQGERSFLVEGMTRPQAAEFAKKFGQESVAHKDGLVMDCGSCILFDGNGPTFLDTVSEHSNHFSALKDVDGNVMAFNFTPTELFIEPEQPLHTLRG